VDIDKLMYEIREFASGEPVQFGLKKPSGKPYWCLRVYGSDKREKQFSLRTPKQKMAEAILDDIKARFRQMHLDRITLYPTEALFDDWLSLYEDRTHARFRAVVDKAVPFMPRYCHEVTEASIERYRDWLVRNKYKPETIRFELTTLRNAFNKAVRYGYTKDNPVANVAKPKKEIPDITYYTQGELDAIFAEFERRAEEGFRVQSTAAWATYREVIYCLHYTGMRIGDALALQWENVSLPFRQLVLRQMKTGKELRIPLPAEFRERLEALTGRNPNPTGFVFQNTAGNMIKYSHMDSAIRRVLKEVGIEKRSPLHSFRHTMAMRLIDQGVSPRKVAAQLGDTLETVIRNYVKPEMMSHDDIDEAFSSQGSRQGPDNMHKMHGFGPERAKPLQPPNTEKAQEQRASSGNSS